MKGLVFLGKERVTVADVPEPRLEADGDVLVSIRLAGICGSDLHPYHEREKGLDPGTIMGHEAVGVVLEAGAAVRGLRKGDRVFGPFSTSCGACVLCRAGLTCRCPSGQLFGWVEKGKGLPGLQAERARVPLADSTMVKVPAGVCDEEALLLGDVLSTGFFCAELAGAAPGVSCAVLGCGPVGLMAVVGARLLGAERVWAVDSLPERLTLAEGFGGAPVRLDPDTAARLRAETAGLGVDAVMEAVGSPAAQRLAYELVRPGGVIAVAGVHTAPAFAFTPAEAYEKNLTYRVGRCPARRMIDRLLPRVLERRFGIGNVISHRLPLAEAPRGYRLFDAKEDGCTKVVLTP